MGWGQLDGHGKGGEMVGMGVLYRNWRFTVGLPECGVPIVVNRTVLAAHCMIRHGVQHRCVAGCQVGTCRGL